MNAVVPIKPQEGPQEQFLSTTADIAIYGGGAGGGKSYGLLLEPIRHKENKDFGAVIFRRNSTQIRNEGGLWDESMKIYPLLGGDPRETLLDYSFPSGCTFSFRHLEHDKTVLDWQGAQIAFIGFDELTHFSAYQFWYMLSRNRSTCGITPYIRATCNPDADSWVAELIAWWIDEETGYPILERAGVIRWFVRVSDELHWFDTKKEAVAYVRQVLKDVPDPEMIPKSLTFIPAKVTDNPALLKVNPEYLANLYALSSVERERLLGGNWKIRASGGTKFKKEFFEIVDDYPRSGIRKRVRYWDFAATDPKPGNDPDWTVGTDMLITNDGVIYIVDVVRFRGTPGKVDEVVKNTATQDGKKVIIYIEEEGGSSGKFTSDHFVKMLIGYIVRTDKPTGNKEVRANPYASYAENGNIKIVRGPWNKAFLDEHEAFPNPDVHDDQVDSASGGFKALTEKPVSTTEAMAKRGRR